MRPATVIVALVMAAVIGFAGFVIEGMFDDLTTLKAELALAKQPEPQPSVPPANQNEVREAVDFYLDQAEQAAAAGDARLAEAAGLEAWREANRLESRDEILAVQDRYWKINAKAHRR